MPIPTPPARRSFLGLLVGGAGLLSSGCVPGTDGSRAAEGGRGVSTAVPDPARAGRVTLTIWDQEIRGGTDGALKELNEAFQERYPNVRLKRVTRNFDNLKTTLKLALTGANPPDVVQANQGYPDMVAFVQAGLLVPLDTYAGVYAWNTRYPATLLNLNRVSADGSTFGTGRLYGISQTGEYIGLYYNKDILRGAGLEVPTTWGAFTRSLDVLHARGELPVQFGNLDRFPAIHTFGVLQDQLDAAGARNTVLGGGPGFDTDATRRAAAQLVDWMERGLLPDGANGLGYDAAAKRFSAGDGAYLLTGTWQLTDLKKAMGSRLGFMPPPPATAGGSPVTTGGQGLAWSITSGCARPDVAAAYLDFITNEHAADVMTRHGVLPAVPGPAAARVPARTVDGQMIAGWTRLRAADGLVPYLDYTTPTFYDTLSANLQELIGGDLPPDRFADALARDHDAFTAQRRRTARDPR